MATMKQIIGDLNRKVVDVLLNELGYDPAIDAVEPDDDACVVREALHGCVCTNCESLRFWLEHAWNR